MIITFELSKMQLPSHLYIGDNRIPPPQCHLSALFNSHLPIQSSLLQISVIIANKVYPAQELHSIVHSSIDRQGINELPMTSAKSFWAMNHESSPNLPNLYLVLSRSFGKPQTTDTRWGRDLLLVSARVLNRIAVRRSRAVVQHIACMTEIQCHSTHTLFIFWDNNNNWLDNQVLRTLYFNRL